MKTWWCSGCKQQLSGDRFSDSKHRSTGKQSYCKKCMKEYGQKTTKAQRNRNLRARFGITLEEYEDMLDAQFFSCAICGIDIDDVQKELAVDHDHLTGKVRGLLCERCNHGLGHFKDSIVFLQNAIRYLKDHADE